MQGNDFTGIAITDYCVVALAAPPTTARSILTCSLGFLADYEATSNQRIIDNIVTNNGLNPNPMHPLLSFAGDLMLLTGGDHGNCYSGQPVRQRVLAARHPAGVQRPLRKRASRSAADWARPIRRADSASSFWGTSSGGAAASAPQEAPEQCFPALGHRVQAGPERALERSESLPAWSARLRRGAVGAAPFAHTGNERELGGLPCASTHRPASSCSREIGASLAWATRPRSRPSARAPKVESEPEAFRYSYESASFTSSPAARRPGKKPAMAAAPTTKTAMRTAVSHGKS